MSGPFLRGKWSYQAWSGLNEQSAPGQLNPGGKANIGAGEITALTARIYLDRNNSDVNLPSTAVGRSGEQFKSGMRLEGQLYRNTGKNTFSLYDPRQNLPRQLD